MKEWLYLTLGFASVSLLSREGVRPTTRSLALSTLRLSIALPLLLAVDGFFRSLLWNPLGREDLASASFLLWALLIDEGTNRLGRNKAENTKVRFFVRRSLLALLGFSAWAASHRDASWVWSLGLPAGSGLFEWLLEGLRDRLRFASIPKTLEGGPILLWLSMLLGLTAAAFVN